MKIKFIISCEHASHAIPKKYLHLFNDKKILLSHRAWDIGADSVFKKIKAVCKLDGIAGKYSRLLVDLNRSQQHAKIFSEFTQSLSEKQKTAIINQYYQPYRDAVIQLINNAIKKNYRVIHVSFHSFTPNLASKKRTNDIGLLYDPKRKLEKEFCEKWKSILHNVNADYKIRMNYPYLGISDGLTSTLRKQFAAKNYLGIEIEMNQKHFTTTGVCKTDLAEDICASFGELLRL